MSVEWHHMLSEAVHRGYLLRVQTTASPRRWRWYVTPQNLIGKPPFNSNLDKAKAHGLSASFERAQADAVAMAERMKEAE